MISVNLESQTPHLLEKFKFEAGVPFEQSRSDVPCLEMLKQVNHQVAVIVIWHIRQTRQWWKERQIRSTRIACCSNMKQMAEIYYWRRFRTLVSWQNKERYGPRINLIKRYKLILRKFVQGRDLRVRSSDSYEKDFRNASDRISLLKQEAFTSPCCQMYQRKFWGYANNGRNLETFFISVHQAPVTRLQDLEKKN